MIGNICIWNTIPLVCIAISLAIFGGGLLLWVGGRFIAKSPKATYWQSVLTHLLSGSIVVILLFLGQWIARYEPNATIVVGIAFWTITLAALLAPWLIIKAMFKTSLFKAILAWLPTLGTFPLLVVLIPPVPGYSSQQARWMDMGCALQIKSICKGVLAYKEENNGHVPVDLSALIRMGVIEKNHLLCPVTQRHHDHCDYFYFPSDETITGDIRRIVACDFADNHPDGSRNVGFSDKECSVMHMTPVEFQMELAKPENAAFAKALEQQCSGPAD